MAGLTFRTVEVAGVGPVVVARGAIDSNTAEALLDMFLELKQRGQDRVVIDCAGLKCVTDTGLDLLIKYADAMKKRGGGITLAGLRPKVSIVFQMLDLFPFFTDVRAEGLVPDEAEPLRVTLTPRASGRPGVALLDAVGAIDEQTSSAELEAFGQAARGGQLDVVVDCSGLLALRGAGLDHLVRRARALADLGGSVALLGVSHEIRRALEQGGLEHAFSVVCVDRPGVSRAPG